MSAAPRLDIEALELTDLEELFVAEPFDAPGVGHYGSRLCLRRRTTASISPSATASPRISAPSMSPRTCRSISARSTASRPTARCRTTTPLSTSTVRATPSGPTATATRRGWASTPRQANCGRTNTARTMATKINVIQGGENFGWPIATWGVDYRTGERFAPTPPEVADAVEPVYWWEPDHPEGFSALRPDLL